jgi:catechol 2,3-dioxygenase-like lactoylglutathione lyase family enzyme
MYTLHHVGLFCESMPASLNFYQSVLQHELIAHFNTAGTVDLAFLAAGSDLLLELIAAPFSDSEQAFIDKRGYALHHLAFAVSDLAASYAALTAAGLRVAWEPDDFLFVRHFGVYDDCGNVVEILQENDPLPKPSVAREFPYQLHHPTLLSDDWQRTEQFYATHFGLRSPFPSIKDHGRRSIYLADPTYHPRKHNCLIKVLGPLLEAADEGESAEKAARIDHNAYVVIDIKTAFEEVVSAGAESLYAPYSDNETDIAWVRDVDGNDLALMG